MKPSEILDSYSASFHLHSFSDLKPLMCGSPLNLNLKCYKGHTHRRDEDEAGHIKESLDISFYNELKKAVFMIRAS